MQEPTDTPIEDIGGRARTAAGWQFLSKGISTALQVVVSIVLARLLMPADFGIVAMAAMVTGLAAVFQDLGLGQALVQRQEISAKHTLSAFWGTLVMAILLYAAIFAAAPHVGAFFHEPRMVIVLQISALSFVLSPFAVVPRSLLQRDLDFKTPFFAGLASSISYGAVGITMALLGYGYWALVFAGLAGAAVGTVALCILTRYLPPIVPSFRGIEDLYGFGVGVTLSGGFSYLASTVDYLVVGRRLDADALGLYTKAFTLVELPTSTISRVVSPVLFPSFAALRKDMPRLRVAYGNLLAVVSFFGFPVMVVFAVIAPEAVPLVLGEQWTGAVRPLQIMTVIGLLKILGPPAGAIIKATGRVYLEMWQQMARAILLAVGAWFAVQWGIEGVALALVITGLISYLLSAWIVYSASGFGLGHQMSAIGGSILTAAIAGALAFAARSAAAAVTDDMAWILIASSTAAVAGFSAILAWGRLAAVKLIRAELQSIRAKIIISR